MVVKRMRLFLMLVLLLSFGINNVYANSIAYPPIYTFDFLTFIICAVVIAITVVCATYTLKVLKKNENKKDNDSNSNNEQENDKK